MNDIERKREENRKRMPHTAELMDSVRAAFGCGSCNCTQRCRVTYACENGHELGKREAA